jgi:tetratricopeptide (TPR) repeat protein
MKATSLKRRELPQPQPEEEKRLNNNSTIFPKKAGLISCLFLCSCICSAQQENEWFARTAIMQAYNLTLNLQVDEARKLIGNAVTPEQLYVVSLGEALELLLTEDEVKFEQFEDAFEVRVEQLNRIKPATTASLFALAELRLQWAFVYLKFGHEFDAAWNIRQAYLLVQQCKKRFPEFKPIKKTSGVLEVMLGSVPEKYQWVISLFGMQGSVEKGLNELQQVQVENNFLKLEASLLYHLIQGYILQETGRAVQGLTASLSEYPTHKLLLFFGASLAIKNSQSEKALELLKRLNENETGIPLLYADYQLGEIYLHKGDYDSAIKHYQKFLAQYYGLNYVKDAYYKTGICFWLQGELTQANSWFDKARQQGKEATEADKYAARSLAESTLPNIKLSKIRYATDGGYYDEAKRIMLSFREADVRSLKEKIEFIYRNARLFDKTGNISEAEKLYHQTIEEQGNENWYFAPNAWLQLGYIYASQSKITEARSCFEKALGYKKHEYKNSIDSKAKSALAKLKKTTKQ